MDISLRIIQVEDANIVTKLSAQLGYSISVQQTTTNISAILHSKSDVAYVAICKNMIIGWIHIFLTNRLESGAFAEIGGMVVDENYRSKGVGKLLVEQGKQWCMDNNIHRLVVRSNVKRNDTHKFYEAIGFEEVKQQKVFDIATH